MAVAFEKQSEGNAQFALGSGRGASLGAGGSFAPFIRAYIHRSGAPEHIGWKVAVKDRQNALKNQYAHLKIQDISIEKVRDSPMMWEPMRYLESCPSSDGACAIVLTDEQGGKDAAADGRPPAWVLGTASRSEPGNFPGRDPVQPAGRGRLRVARVPPGRHHQPPRADQHGRAVRAVLLARGDLARRPRHRRARRGLEDDRQRRDRDRRLVPGELLRRRAVVATRSARPGLLRFAEAALQVRGMAGEHQVDGAKVALAQAYGANSQYFSMWVVANSLDPFA